MILGFYIKNLQPLQNTILYTRMTFIIVYARNITNVSQINIKPNLSVRFTFNVQILNKTYNAIYQVH